MTVSGFTFIRNGVYYDYPFLEAIRSILPLCDELVVAVGAGQDDTRERIAALGDSRIRILDTVWDENLREGGRVLAQQTDLALAEIQGDWGLYIQGDEVLHEQYQPVVRQAMERYLEDGLTEGLLFRYLHFYGSSRWVGRARQWYRQEVRVVRNLPGIHSWKDAQGFRRDGRKLKVRPIPADMYHYGWARHPRAQQRKQEDFNKLWHDDQWIERHVVKADAYDYRTGAVLRPFSGTHPQVMAERLAQEDWTFDYTPRHARPKLKERLTAWIEHYTNWRPGEYRNFQLLPAD